MGEECWLFNRAWGKDRDDTRKLEIVIPSILDTCVWGCYAYTLSHQETCCGPAPLCQLL